ncbi:5-fold beta-flower protein [Spirosoma sp.]|uniref:5-fold beta-flower protein n=1 Tax=Spirosoma sp. TaxID=1899569 RepID=UPI002610A4E6|nr:hypothetical protein [Spirosoma sp.]MCX6212929.1 hypothetical protein [Spirosoma sp.]
MKPLLITLLLLAFTTISLSASAQNYKHITPGGEIKDEHGATIGSITKDQIILDNKGKKIAFVDTQGNLVDAKTNKKLGRMGKDGKNYYDAQGEIEFKLKENGSTCDVYDAKGKKIGNVHSSMKGAACALACFEESHRKKAK